jgi:thioesterase domain-containing protein
MDVCELSIEGPIDPEKAVPAEFVGWNLRGSLPPLVLIRTWDNELPQHQRLARELGADQPIYSMGHPVGDRDEDYPQDTAAWVDFCMKRFARLPLVGPVRIGGWSFGGVIALGVASRLQASGREIALVALLDSRVPKRKAKRGMKGLQNIAIALNEYASLHSEEERAAYLRSELKRRSGKIWKWLGRIPTKRLRRRRQAPEGKVLVSRGKPMGRLKRAVHVCYLKYRPERFDLPIAQFWTADSRARADGDASLGWMHAFDGEIQIVGVAGDHGSMFDEAHIGPLARGLETALERSRRAAGALSKPDPART